MGLSEEMQKAYGMGVDSQRLTIARLTRERDEAREATREAEDCSTGGGDMRCGRCVACLSRVIGRDEAGVSCACDDCCGHGQEDSSCVPIADVEEWVRKWEEQLGKELAELEGRAESAELGCEIAYRREPTAAEGEAYAHQMCEGAIVESHVPAGNWHGHRCTCGKWVWGGGTVCQGCVDAQAVRAAIAARDEAREAVKELEERWAAELGHANRYHALLRDRDERLARVAEAAAEYVGHEDDDPDLVLIVLRAVDDALHGWRRDHLIAAAAREYVRRALIHGWPEPCVEERAAWSALVGAVEGK